MTTAKCPTCKGSGEVEAPKMVPCGCDCKHKLCGLAYAAEVICDFCYYGNAFDDYPHNNKGRKERAALRKSQEGKLSK